MIAVGHHLMLETFTYFRQCGEAQHECVVYWIGPSELPTIVDEVIHPLHTVSSGGYEVDRTWSTTFWWDLAKRRKSVHVQVHTHPHQAFHSRTDNEWAIVHTSGLLSLVIPNFAQGPVGLSGAYLAERTAQGWRQVSIPAHLTLT